MRRALGALVAGVLLTLIAFVFDASPLFVVGLALTLLALGCGGWVLAAARGAAIERKALPARVIEGQPVLTQIRLTRGPLGLPGATVTDPLDSDEFRSPRRGLHRIAPPVLRIADGLRPYRPGTPASRIHWPALARGAGLLERRLHADGEELPLVVLDTRGDVELELLDAAVRAAASLILALAVAGGARALLPGARRQETVGPDLIAWHQLHARLAVVQGGPSAPPPALDGQRSGAARFYVAAGGSRFAPGGKAAVLVVPAALAPSSGVSFEVGGCVGYAPGTGRQRQAA